MLLAQPSCTVTPGLGFRVTLSDELPTAPRDHPTRRAPSSLVFLEGLLSPFLSSLELELYFKYNLVFLSLPLRYKFAEFSIQTCTFYM